MRFAACKRLLAFLLALMLALGCVPALAEDGPKVTVTGDQIKVTFQKSGVKGDKLMYQLVDENGQVVLTALNQGAEWAPEWTQGGTYKVLVYYVDNAGYTVPVESEFFQFAGSEPTAAPTAEPTPVATAVPTPVPTEEPTAEPEATLVPDVDADVENDAAEGQEMVEPGDIKLLDIQETPEGFVEVSWSDPGSLGPCRLLFKRVNEDGTTENQVGWYYDVRETYFTLTELKPGATYQIVLRDNHNQTLDTREFTMAQPAAFSDVKMKLNWARVFSGDSMINDPAARSLTNKYETANYGLRCKWTFPKLGEDLEFSMLCVVTAPNGFEYAHQEQVTFKRGETWTTWQWELEYMLEVLKTQFGGVPQGEYKVETYYNGQSLTTGSFSLR